MQHLFYLLFKEDKNSTTSLISLFDINEPIGGIPDGAFSLDFIRETATLRGSASLVFNWISCSFSEIKVPNLKLQKWCKYILALSGRTIQIWIDGVIVNTEYLPSLPVFYDIQSAITIGQINNNFQGKIRNLIMYPYPLSYTELQNIQKLSKISLIKF